MADAVVLVTPRTCPETASSARRIDTRSLDKRASWSDVREVPDEIVDSEHETVRDHEREIAERADVDPNAVILDVPDRPSMRESSSRVVVNGEVRALGSQSTLVGALRRTHREQWRLGVYAPEDATDRVGRAAESILGLDLDALVVDVRKGINATLDEF